MSKFDASLLDQIEDDAVNGRPIADTLRKVVVLGGRAGSTALRDWATKELKGYGPDDELPEYRTIGAPICVDAIVGNGWIKGQRMSIHELPKFAQEVIKEEVPLIFPIGQIEAIIQNVEKGEDNTAHLSPPGTADLVLLWNHESDVPFQHIQSVYWSVSLPTLHGVIDQVRTTLTELVAEMRAGTPSGQDLPSADVTNQAVSVAIHGKNNRVTVKHQTAGGDATATTTVEAPKEPGWWTATRIAWTAVVGVAGIAGAWFTYLQMKG